VQSSIKSHLEPAEQNKKVLAVMEEALRLGRLTEAKNKIVFWMAVHHLSGWAFGQADEEWNRLQLLKRLNRSCPDVLELVVSYKYEESCFPPPPNRVCPEERKFLVAKLNED
jgi:hypothetical protein